MGKPVPYKIDEDSGVQQIFEHGEWTAVIIRFPVADGAGKTIAPVEREEGQRSIAVMGENVNDCVKQHTNAEPKQRPCPAPLPAHAPPSDAQQGCVNHQRVKEIVADNPDRVGVEQLEVQIFHNTALHRWRGKPTIDNSVDDSEHRERNVRQHRTDEQCRFVNGVGGRFGNFVVDNGR